MHGTSPLQTVGTAMACRIVGALGQQSVSRVFLYGSRARGDAVPESDWDLLVVLEEGDLSREHRGQLRRMCRREMGQLRPWADVRVVGSSEFERGRKARGSLVEAACRSGTQIYPNPVLGEDFFENADAVRACYRDALALLAR